MKLTSNIFSWAVGLGTTALIVILVLAETSIAMLETKWIIGGLILGVIFRFVLLIWRQIAVNDGGPTITIGVLTIVFVSIVGGILTILLDPRIRNNNQQKQS